MSGTDLTGKLALVTGGAKNVGRAIAAHLAARGAHVIINYFHSHDEAKETRTALEAQGARIELIRASVAQPAQVDRLFQEIEARFGYLDILVNNAADGALVPLDEVTEALLDRAWDTNLKGSLWCAQRAAPLMARRGGGSIINLSTLGGGQLVLANYAACGPAKAAVEALTRYLAVEFAPHNIRVNTAASGPLESRVVDRFPRADALKQFAVHATPLGRLGRPEDLARVVGFLASDDAAWITGQVLLADGGLSLGSALLLPSRGPEVLPEVPLPEAREEEEPQDGDEIAVVGMGLAVAGASSPAAFWDVLTEGPDLYATVPPERWDCRSFCAPDRAQEDKSYQDISVFLENFTPTPALAAEAPAALAHYEYTTLWLRHSLLQALEGVGRNPEDRFSFSVGYTADGNQHLEEALVLANVRQKLESLLKETTLKEEERQTLRGQLDAVLEGRYARGATDPARFLPHQVGWNALKGILPEHTELHLVDTACSSSLYAIDIAIKGLQSGKTDVAVCGGALAIAPRGAVLFAKLSGMSVGGVVRSLDQDCDGVLFADGAGVVVLKKLKRARADGDRILGVITAVGACSDGKGKAIYAPSPEGQRRAIEQALARLPEQHPRIDWVVAHGTGTPAGDRAEFATLRETFAADHPVYVSSNKSLIGHTGWAAGIVSLIEVLLAFQKDVIPRQFNFSAAPASFELETSNLRIPTEPVSWPRDPSRPRAAAVSGFGFGGTNAHLIVREDHRRAVAPPPATHQPEVQKIVLVGWSAHVPGLDSRAGISSWLKGGTGPALSFGESYPAPAFDQVRLPPRTIRTVDRCQLMILECAHQLRNQLGTHWDESSARTGVFLGHLGATRNASAYGVRCYLDDLEGALRADTRLSASPVLENLLEGLRREAQRAVPPSNEDAFPGSMPNVIPARVANYFDLQGPNMTLDTGFSSTLTAFEVASRYLQSGELTMALVGGINGNTSVEMQAVVASLFPGAPPALAEGAFLFSLVTEETARRWEVPVLAYVDSMSDSCGRTTATIPCGPDAAGPNYLGAEGARAVLQALQGPRTSPVTITCQETPGGPVQQLPLSFPASPALSPDEKPFAVRRQVCSLEDLTPETVREPLAFWQPGMLLLTNSPALLREAGHALPDGSRVLSTVPLPPELETPRCVYLPEITPEAVAAHLGRGEFPTQLRLISDLGMPREDLAAPEGLIALHDLAFLVLQQGGEVRQTEGAAFLSLFLNAMPAGGFHPFAGCFGGLIKVAHLERPGSLIFGLFTDDSTLREGVARAESESTLRRFLPVVGVCNGRRRAVFLTDAPADAPRDAPAPLTASSVVVAVGGTRGITAAILKELARLYRPRLYILGSNPLDDYPAGVFEGSDADFARQRPAFLREQKAAHPGRALGELNREFERRQAARASRHSLDALEQLCGVGRVTYLAGDLADRARVAHILAQIQEEAGPIDLLINAAGLNHSAPIASKDFHEFRRIRDLKVQGYLNLKRALQGNPPRLWCNFGSLLGLTGQHGEVDYASGNDFLATAADYSRRSRGGDEFTIGWCLWGEVGLGASPLLKAHLERVGPYTPMTTAEGIAHFLRELALPQHEASTLYTGEAELSVLDRLAPGYVAHCTRPASDAGFYLGKILSRTDDEIWFERVFDRERDDYLEHHRVNGYPTFPGTFVPEIAHQAATALVPDLQVVAFEDIAFHHFLRVYGAGQSGPKKIHARLLTRETDQARVRVRVLTDIVSPGGVVLTRDKVHFELDVLLHRHLPPAPAWESWDLPGEVPIPDPYHQPVSPVLLTGMFVSTENTRSHPLGKRADYRLRLEDNHPAFRRFRLPSILLDGLARVGVVNYVEDDYVPLAALGTIRRIDLYEAGNDLDLSRRYGSLELYATPREFALDCQNRGGGPNRAVAVRPDGKIVLQIKDMTGTVLGYIHRTTGAFVSPEQLRERQTA